MIIGEIAAYLHTLAPPDTAEAWDNVGLLVGNESDAVSRVLLTLDITPDAVERARQEGAGLIISHHPVIFHPLSRLGTNEVPYRLAQYGIAALCLHTNLDKAAGGVNDVLAARLGLLDTVTAPDGTCRIGRLAEPLPPAAFTARVAAALHTAVRRGPCGHDAIGTVGVCGGAGGDLMLPLLEEVDAFVTGEIRHHEWLTAGQSGALAIEAGHYATEAPVVDALADWLSARFPSLEWIIHRGRAPYQIEMEST